MLGGVKRRVRRAWEGSKRFSHTAFVWGAKRAGVPERDFAILLVVLTMILIGFVFVVTAQLSQLSDRDAAEQQRAHYEQARSAETKYCGVVFPVGRAMVQCVQAADETAREQERQEYDLEAYRDSAAWTKATAEVAFVGGGIAILTIILLYHTLQAQRRTIRETTRIGEAQTRAYLSITDCRVQFNSGNPNVRLKIRNSGQSPALKVKWRANVTAWPDGAPKEEFREGRTDADLEEFEHDVPAQGSRWTLFHHCRDNFAIGAVEAAALAADTPVNLAVFAKAKGVDVFGNDVKASATFLYIMEASPDDGEIVKLTLGTS